MPHTRARRGWTALCLVVLLLVGTAPPAGATSPAQIVPVLDGAFASVDAYWHQTQAAAGLPAPSVRHVWVAPGAHVPTACGVPADDKNPAFYCKPDDTIYVSETFAGAISEGRLPSEQANLDVVAGNVAVAYVVAHEYAHDIQHEDGIDVGRTRALPLELNADCLAGTWIRWAYGQGAVDDAGIQQALDAALAVGDFDLVSPQHHGTPTQRRDAVLTGIRGGTPAACDGYLQL
jgi:predicted metalloprotease